MSQGSYHWYQSRPPSVLHRDSEKEPTARKRWGAGEEALGGPLPESMKKRRGEPRKNGEMDWVKLPSVTPLTVVKTAQCHTFNDEIPPMTSVFKARWFVTSQMTKSHIQNIQDSISIYKPWAQFNPIHLTIFFSALLAFFHGFR